MRPVLAVTLLACGLATGAAGLLLAALGPRAVALDAALARPGVVGPVAVLALLALVLARTRRATPPATAPSGPTAPPSGPTAPPSGPTAPPSGTTAPPSGTTAPPSATRSAVSSGAPPRRRWPWVLLGLGALAATALVALGLVATVGDGGPSSSDALVVLGGLVAGAGVGTLAVHRLRAGRSTRPARRRRAAATTVVGTLVVVGTLATGAALAGPDLPVVSSTGDAPAAVAPVPARPTGVRWTWAARSSVQGVQAGGPGAVVVDGSAVVGLDTTTGTERWRFRRIGTAVRGAADEMPLVVSPDGRTVVVTDDAGHVTVLDAVSGTRRWSLRGRVRGVTDRVVVIGGGTLSAHDVVTGAVVWAVPAPPCLTSWGTPRAVGVVPVVCGEQAVTALDERDGRPRWSVAPPPRVLTNRPSDAAEEPVHVHSTPDGRTVLVGRDVASTLLALDPATGGVRGVVHTAVPNRAGDLDVRHDLPGPSDEPPARGVDPSSGATFALPAPCPSMRVEALRVPGGATTSFCLDDPLAVHVEGGGVIPVPLAPSPEPTGRGADPAPRFLVPTPGAIVVADTDDTTGGVIVGLA